MVCAFVFFVFIRKAYLDNKIVCQVFLDLVFYSSIALRSVHCHHCGFLFYCLESICILESKFMLACKDCWSFSLSLSRIGFLGFKCFVLFFDYKFQAYWDMNVLVFSCFVQLIRCCGSLTFHFLQRLYQNIVY